VEHDEDVMKASDHIVDIGPRAGLFGGEVVYNGPSDEIENAENSLTGMYLRGELEIPVKEQVRQPTNFIEIIGASQHNLKKHRCKNSIECNDGGEWREWFRENNLD
jgi:excinuclease ABC subunit A